MKQTFFTILLIAGLFVSSNAQKFGYINTQELLLGMSEMKLADNDVQKSQNDLLIKAYSRLRPNPIVIDSHSASG